MQKPYFSMEEKVKKKPKLRMRPSQSTKPTKDPFFKGTNETDSDLRTTLNDPYFETSVAPYKECTNPNDPNDKSLCVVVQDASPFDGAVVRYTSFKLVEQELGGEDIACQYEYDIEVPPHDLGYEITDKDGEEFERKLGEWVIEILQRQMDKHAAADRDNNTEKSDS